MGFSRQEYWSGVPLPDVLLEAFKGMLSHAVSMVMQQKPCLCQMHETTWVSQVALVVKNLPENAGDARDIGLIPGLGRSTGGGNGLPLLYSSLENP